MDSVDSLPEAFWTMFPPSGNYIKNILKFSGYDTPESIIKLKDEAELGKGFDFVKSVSDIVPNTEEMFGIFCGNPQSVVLIPGLKVTT